MLRVLDVVYMLQSATETTHLVHESVGDHKQPLVLSYTRPGHHHHPLEGSTSDGYPCVSLIRQRGNVSNFLLAADTGLMLLRRLYRPCRARPADRSLGAEDRSAAGDRDRTEPDAHAVAKRTTDSPRSSSAREVCDPIEPRLPVTRIIRSSVACSFWKELVSV
jgi:hypothetical protein